MIIIACLIIGYFIGTINPAYLISRAKGFDIRDQGSGNAGATNVAIMMGKSFGVVCAVVDILKGLVSYRLARAIFPAIAFAGIIAGVGAIVGHIFPFWMGFRGGKGLATLAGVAIGFNWKFFLAALLCEAVVLFVGQYIALVSVTGPVVLTVGYGVMTHDVVGTVALLVVAVIMLFKHRENLERIAKGHEVRLRYMWDPESELERLKDIYPDGLDSAR